MKRINDIKDFQKPCHICHFCPYGVMVEEYPLQELARQYARDHNMWVKFVKDDAIGHGHYEKCSKKDKDAHEDMDNAVRLVDDPYSCDVFGHDCPVYYLAESITERGMTREQTLKMEDN